MTALLSLLIRTFTDGPNAVLLAQHTHMRRGRIEAVMASEQTLPKSGVFKGIVRGDARVTRGSNLHIRGIISGNLTVEAGSTVLLTGIVSGRLLDEGADLTIEGIVGAR